MSIFPQTCDISLLMDYLLLITVNFPVSPLPTLPSPSICAVQVIYSYNYFKDEDFISGWRGQYYKLLEAQKALWGIATICSACSMYPWLRFLPVIGDETVPETDRRQHGDWGGDIRSREELHNYYFEGTFFWLKGLALHVPAFYEYPT